MKYKLCLISLCGCRRWIQENLQWLRFASALHFAQMCCVNSFRNDKSLHSSHDFVRFLKPSCAFFPFTIHYFLFFWRLLRSKRSRSMLISPFIPLFFYFMHLLVTNFSANFLNPFHLQTYFAFECLSKSYLKYDSEFGRKRDKCSEVKVCVDANVYIISDHASKTYLSDSSNSFYLLDSIINDDALNIYRFCRYYIWPFFSCQSSSRSSFFNLT